MADKSTRPKRYSEEFRLQAAKLIVEGGVTYHQASQQLGVSDWALRC
jgi:transposase-like protein